MIMLEMTEEQYQIIKVALSKSDDCMKEKYPDINLISYSDIFEDLTRYEIGEPCEAD